MACHAIWKRKLVAAMPTRSRPPSERESEARVRGRCEGPRVIRDLETRSQEALEGQATHARIQDLENSLRDQEARLTQKDQALEDLSRPGSGTGRTRGRKRSRTWSKRRRELEARLAQKDPGPRATWRPGSGSGIQTSRELADRFQEPSQWHEDQGGRLHEREQAAHDLELRRQQQAQAVRELEDRLRDEGPGGP